MLHQVADQPDLEPVVGNAEEGFEHARVSVALHGVRGGIEDEQGARRQQEEVHRGRAGRRGLIQRVDEHHRQKEDRGQQQKVYELAGEQVAGTVADEDHQAAQPVQHGFTPPSAPGARDTRPRGLE